MPDDTHSARGDQTAARRLARQLIDTLWPCRHSKDFRSVAWFGHAYTFTALQAAIVRQLWEAWETGTPELSTETLLEDAGADRDTGRIDHVFRDHPALGPLITKGTTKGAWQLHDGQEFPDSQ